VIPYSKVSIKFNGRWHIVVREIVGIYIAVDTRWSEIPQMEVKRMNGLMKTAHNIVYSYQ